MSYVQYVYFCQPAVVFWQKQKDFKSPWTFTVSDAAVVRDQKRELERKRVEDKEKFEMGICFADAQWQCVREMRLDGYALGFYSADHADEMSLVCRWSLCWAGC